MFYTKFWWSRDRSKPTNWLNYNLVAYIPWLRATWSELGQEFIDKIIAAQIDWIQVIRFDAFL